MPNTTEIVEPGRYDYKLTVQFPSTYVPEHAPPAFRLTAHNLTDPDLRHSAARACAALDH